MYQSDRGNYRTKDSVSQEFFHSCLGRIIIVAGVCCVLLIVAMFTVPDEETMMVETIDNVCQCIQSNDSIKEDKVDNWVSNVGYTFTHVDSTFNDADLELFYKYNRIEQHRHAFYATTYVLNNIHPEGKCVGLGMFGIVIPTLSYKDFLMYVGKMRGNYNERIIQENFYEEPYTGENPNVKEYHYEGDLTQ